MKKFYLKTMLAAVALVFGAGAAHADEITATLVHTASTTGNGNNATITVSVDAEKEPHNNENAKSWDGYAFAEFSYEIPDGHVITSAKLTWTAYGNSNKERSSKVYILNEGKTIDYEAIQATPVLLPFMGEKDALTGDMSIPSKKDVTYTTDVTEAVQAMAAAQDYVIFQWTKNAQGGELYGKASAKAPVLVLTTKAAVSAAYTVKFVDGSDNDVKASVTHMGIAGELPTLPADDKASFIADGKKYLYVYDTADDSAVTADGSTVVYVTFREAEAWTAVLTNNLNGKTIEKTGFENENVDIAYPTFLLSDGVIYSTTKQSSDGKGYYVTMNLSSDGVSREIAYTATSTSDIVYLAEMENVEGATAVTAANTFVRSSNGGSAYAESEALTLTTLAPGKYVMKAVVCDATKTPSASFQFAAGDEVVLTTTPGAVNWAESTSEEFTIKTDTDIKLLAGAGNANVGVDFVYIQKTGEYVPAKLYTEAGAIDDYYGGAICDYARNVAVDVYEDNSVIVRNFAGAPGYDLKVTCDADDKITSIAYIQEGVEKSVAISGGWSNNIYTGLEDVEKFRVYMSYSAAGLGDDNDGYIQLYTYDANSGSYGEYYIYWPQEPLFAEGLYQVSGTVKAIEGVSVPAEFQKYLDNEGEYVAYATLTAGANEGEYTIATNEGLLNGFTVVNDKVAYSPEYTFSVTGSSRKFGVASIDGTETTGTLAFGGFARYITLSGLGIMYNGNLVGTVEDIVLEPYASDFADFEDVLVDPATGLFTPEDDADETCWWNSGDYTFATYTDDWGVKYYYDFVVTNSVSADFSTTADQYNSAAGGAYEGTNYAVWYDNFYGNSPVMFPEAGEISGFYVTNTAWVVDAILNGDGMSDEADETVGKPFGYSQDDKLTLTITGYDEDEQSTGTVEYTLAEVKDSKLYYVKDWRWVDLTSLGDKVISVKFAVSSTKANKWGATSPKYFCMDNFGGEAPAVDAEMAVVDLNDMPTCATATAADAKAQEGKFVKNGKLIIVKGGKAYNAAGTALK